MGLACSFALNRQGLSPLVCPGVGSFPAFSGHGAGRDNPAMVGEVDSGALPSGRSSIVDRQPGGRLGWLWDWQKRTFGSTDHATWFALYRDDGAVNDTTIINGVRRGSFRLHPIGPLGFSEGCITLVNPPDFAKLRDALKSASRVVIPQGASPMVPSMFARIISWLAFAATPLILTALLMKLFGLLQYLPGMGTIVFDAAHLLGIYGDEGVGDFYSAAAMIVSLAVASAGALLVNRRWTGPSLRRPSATSRTR